MGFDLVISHLLNGFEIRRTSQPEIHYVLGMASGERALVMYTPKFSMPPIKTSFDAEDLLAADWEKAN